MNQQRLRLGVNIDHVTAAVSDVVKAKAFFSLLGFVEQQTVVISRDQFSEYMGVAGIEAEHVAPASSPNGAADGRRWQKHRKLA
jgi:catechol 2,3-dioxygenase-like lactoylglutathione lyase family enzyme